jgi:hypothetical protein
VPFLIAVVFSEADLKSIGSSMFLPGVALDFGHLELPYHFAMKAFLDSCFRRRDEFRQMAKDKGAVLPLGCRVRFVFDHNNEKAIFLREWTSY